MRHLLIIFLMVLMPLQLSWAAMASYCQHESGVAAKHFGHHEHQHQTKAVEPGQDQTKSLSTFDADCSICHACCVVILADTHDVPSPGIASLPLAWDHDSSLPAFPSRPERPNWVTLA